MKRNFFIKLAAITLLASIPCCMPSSSLYSENISDVKSALDAGEEINSVSRDYTPLIWAVSTKHWDVAKYLIERGADINRKGPFNRTAMMYAAMHNNAELAKSLIERGANIKDTDERGYSALHYAISPKSSIELVKILVDNGADLYQKVRIDEFTSFDANLLILSAMAYRQDLIEFFKGSGLSLKREKSIVCVGYGYNHYSDLYFNWLSPDGPLEIIKGEGYEWKGNRKALELKPGKYILKLRVNAGNIYIMELPIELKNSTIYVLRASLKTDGYTAEVYKYDF